MSQFPPQDPNQPPQQSVNPFSENPNPYQTPIQSDPQPAQPMQQATQGDATGGVIPYKNPCALIAYYLGIFSFVPGIGLFLGIAAVVLGFMGLRNHAKNPVIKGVVHAWIGIIAGGLFTLIWLGCIGFMFIGIASAAAS